jgi:DNA-directed RNA polymerase II subunit RPB1
MSVSGTVGTVHVVGAGDEPRLQGLTIKLLSTEEIINSSVCHVTSASLFKGWYPVDDGPYDARMGTTSNKYVCKTCGLDIVQCIGHPGHIELPVPVVNPLYVDTVLKIIRTVCLYCNRVCIPRGGGDVGVAALVSVRGKKKCTLCDRPRPTFSKDKLGLIRIKWDKAVLESMDDSCGCASPASPCAGVCPRSERGWATLFNSEVCRDVLQAIPDEDYTRMGYHPAVSHPKDMIMCAFVVPPPLIRPPFLAAEGSKTRGRDDATGIIQSLVKIIQSGADEEQLTTVMSLFMKGGDAKDTSGYQRRAGSGVVKQLKGKHGHVRELQGKRCDFSSRTVLTGDPYIDLDEVGVPPQIADVLTTPEVVSCMTLHYWQREVRAKNSTVKNIIRRTHNGTYSGEVAAIGSAGLKVGDVVERKMRDGDWLVMNRQPSLHRMSMMGHRVRILPGQSFRISPPICKPYNADFDGDEMNGHFPQSALSCVEVADIMSVETHLISPGKNSPCVGLMWDSCIGLFELTQDGVTVPRDQVMQLAMTLDSIPTADWTRSEWTGRQVCSLLFPPGFYLRKGNVVIEDGCLVQGTLTSATTGAANGGIIHLLVLDFGAPRAAQFVNEAQRMALQFLQGVGFSVGWDDCQPAPNTLRAVEDYKAQRYAVAENLMTDVPEGCDQEAFEAAMYIVNNVMPDLGTLCGHDDTSTIQHIVKSGAKGTHLNMAMIAGCVGTQVVGGGGYIVPPPGSNRTLSCFPPHTTTPASSGFIASSYSQGLRPHELFLQAKSGREGMVDTAVKTASTGYNFRQLVTTLHGATGRWGGSVLNPNGMIVQTLYGGNGLLPSSCERVRLEYNLPRDLTPLEMDRLTPLAHTVRSMLVDPSGRGIDTVCLPFNATRLRDRRPQGAVDDPLSAVEASDSIGELLDYFHSIHPLANLTILEFHLRSAYTTEECGRVSAAAFRATLLNMRQRYDRASLVADEAVGTCAAQSIGEPCTQMTLNTFHSAGQGNKLGGVPRIRELMNVTKNPSTPQVILPVASEEEGMRLLPRLKIVTWDKILSSSPQVVSNAEHTEPWEEEAVARHVALVYQPPDLSEWVCRLLVSTSKLREYHHTIPSLATLQQSDKVDCVYGPTPTPGLGFLRLRFVGVDTSSAMDAAVTEHLSHPVCGVPGVTDGVLHLSPPRIVLSSMCVPSLATSRLVSDEVFHRLYATDIHTVHEHFGIEAARTVLIKELMDVIEGAGIYVNPHHITLTVDMMTVRGYLMPTTRHGLNRISDNLT